MVSDPLKPPQTPSGDTEPGSLDLPISMVQHAAARVRRGRWMLLAIAVVAVMLLVAGRINLSEALLSFGFLALVALFASPRANQDSVMKRQQIARRSSRPSFEQLITAWPQPVILVDPQLTIRTINAAASDLLDISAPGDPLSFRLREPDVLAAVQVAFDKGEATTQTILERVPSERLLRLHIRPFAYTGTSDLPYVASIREHGPARFVLVVIEDETATYRSERVRSDFVANASHELRTPLASISGCIETLQGPAKNDPDGQKRFLSMMGEQAERMTALIDDLLSLNRIEMRAHRAPTALVDLHAIARQAIDAAHPMAIDAGITLSLDSETSQPTVRGDAAELGQIASNLLQNAIKYGAAGERVEVTLRDALEGGIRMVELQVRDYGAGIAPEHLPRLTERFYRAHQAGNEASNPLVSGTGLGLAIVKHVLARHRGRLLVESASGEGASFSVRIPYLAATVKSDVDEKRHEKQTVKLSHD